MKPADKRYVGIDQDLHGGMTDTGKIIRDAWAFELIPESQTCAGWNIHAIEQLWERVEQEWRKYGFRVSNLPPALQQRYLTIQEQALVRAKAAGWDGTDELMSDS